MIKSSQLSQNSRVIRKRYGLSHKPDLTAATEAAARSKSALNAVPGRVGATGALPNFTGKFLSTSYKHKTCRVLFYFLPHSDPECKKFEKDRNATFNTEMGEMLCMLLQSLLDCYVFLYPAITFSVSSIIRSHTLLFVVAVRYGSNVALALRLGVPGLCHAPGAQGSPGDLHCGLAQTYMVPGGWCTQSFV